MSEQHWVRTSWFEKQALDSMLLSTIDLAVNASSHIRVVFDVVMHGFIDFDFASSTFLQFLEYIKVNHLL